MNIFSSIEKAKALALVLHCADISHPGKPWSIHHAWTESLMEEFFKQGEKEKELGLPCSPLCDRENTLIGESQIGTIIVLLLLLLIIDLFLFLFKGFIQYIVEPSFVVMGDMLEKILKSSVNTDPETPSPLAAAKSIPSSSSPSPSVGSSVESNVSQDELNRTEKKLPASMTTPIPRSTILRRPWSEYLKSNRERWIREAGQRERFELEQYSISFFVEEERRRKELKTITEET